MRNKATICRIDCVGCGYCSCSWCTSFCDFYFTFGSCGIFLITNTWLKRGNNNLSLGTILFEDFLFLCWNKSIGACIHFVAGCLLNHVIAFFEVFDFILSWDLDYCRRCRNYHCLSFMRNKTAVCRVNSIGCDYCSGTWNTSYCDF